MHMSGSEKAEKIFQYLRYFIEEPGSKIININVKVLDDSRNRIISQPMLREQFLNKFINLSMTHGISDIDCKVNNIEYGYQVVVSKISLRIQLTKGIDNITPDIMETLYKLPMHSCTIFEDVSWTS